MGKSPIYHYHIRKTGGTSLNYMFLALAADDPSAAYQKLVHAAGHQIILQNKKFCGWNKKVIEGGRYFYGFSHIPYHSLTIPSRCFTISVFRDPVARVFSHYKMLRTYQQNGTQHPCMKREGPWIGSGFVDFIDRIPDKDCLNQLFMFSKSFQVAEAVECVADLDVAFMGKNFDRGVAVINRKQQIALRPIHVRKTEVEESVPCSAWEKLRDRLQLEYDFLEELRVNNVLVK